MNDKNVIKFSNTNITNTPNTASKTRARSFKVISVPAHNFAQYVRTVKAYALAGMTFADVANAGDFLGDKVERLEIDAPLQQDWKNKVGEVADDENQILAWQARGEKVSITAQLSSPAGTRGREVVVISKDLIKAEPAKEQTIEVVEGIQVSLQQTPAPSLPNSTSDSQLENNPYLQPIAGDPKKPT